MKLFFNPFKWFKKEEIKKIPPSFAKKGDVVSKNKPVSAAKKEKIKSNKSYNNKNIKNSSKNSVDLKKEHSSDKEKETNKNQASSNSGDNNELDYINSVFGKKNNNSSSDTGSTNKKESFGFG